MSLRYFYRPDWRLNPAIEITDHVRLYTLDITENAEESNPAYSTIVLDDDEGTLDIPAMTRIWVTETEVSASSNTHVFDGYILDRTFRRGDSALTSTARIIEMNVADENSIISRRVMSSPSANRPAETDVQRVQWLANEADGQLLIDDTTFLFSAGPVSMDAADYRGQTGAEVLNDCAQASGKNHYFYMSNVGSAIWYGSEDHTAHNSMLRLSNVLGDIDNITTFAISLDSRLVRDPSRLLSGVYYQYETAATYVRNQAMFPEIGMRDLPFSSTNVKTQAKAIARANRYLAENDSEEDRITTSVRVPARMVNFIRAGMRIPFRCTYMPGYEEYVFLRVYRRSVVQDSEETYLLTLELGTNSIPPSPTEEGEGAGGTAVIDAVLEIGSAAFVGDPSDREFQFGSQVGAATPTLVVGRQYRLVVDVIFDKGTPSLIQSGPSYAIVNPNATLNAIIRQAGGPPTPDWDPNDGTDTSTLTYGTNGISFFISGGGSAYVTGTHVDGDWLTLMSVAGGSLTADVQLAGEALSGFWGFHHIARVQLMERTP